MGITFLPRRHALAAVLLSMPFIACAEDDYRLAFSRAENIEVFVEGKTRDNWCAEHLNLRVRYGAAVDTGAWERLLPKVGGLLAQQCKEAKTLNWRSVDSNGAAQAQGKSSAALGWQLQAVTAEIDAGNKDNAGNTDNIAANTSSAKELPAEKAVEMPAEVLSNNFAVAGWQPPDAEKQAKLTDLLRTLSDQNGCKIVSRFEPGIEDYLSIRSEGLKCGEDGYAQGMGRLVLERADGVQILRSNEHWFSHGLIFERNDKVKGLSADKIVEEREGRAGIWFDAGSDAQSHSHYFLHADWVQYGNNGELPVLQINWRFASLVQLYVLTDAQDTFRNAISIRKAIDSALLALTKNVLPGAETVSLVFTDKADSLTKDQWSWDGLSQDLYNIRATQHTAGIWKYNLQNSTNYLFAREQRQAQEKRRQQEQAERERKMQLYRQAQQERSNLNRYQGLARLSEGELRALLEQDIGWSALPDSRYSRLLQGAEDRLQRIVHVSGNSQEDALVDLPYPMKLPAQGQLKKGWYLIAGKRHLDSRELDDEGLPMTVVLVNKEGSVQPCEQDGCADRLSALAVMRMELNNSDWSPETAQTVIDSAATL